MRYSISNAKGYASLRLVVLMLVGTMLVSLLPACAHAQDTVASSQVSSMSAAQIEPNAGKWKTWVLSSGSQLRVAAPPARKATKAEIKELEVMESQRDAVALDLINFWDAGPPSYRWNEIAISEIAKGNLNNPRGTRAMSLLNVAIYDAIVAAWDSKYAYNRPRPSDFNPAITTVIPNPQSPSYPSEHAVAAGAASTILTYLFPNNAKLFSEKADEAVRSRLLAGVQYPSDISAGLDLGRAVASLVVDAAKSDGSDARWTGAVPTGPGLWKGTNPAEPMAGTWKTWVLTSGSQFRPGPPPAFDSAQEMTELAEVKSVPRSIPAVSNFDTTRAAYFWQGQFLKYWTDLTSQKILEYRLDNNPPRAARVYAIVSIACYEGMVACWDAKYTYWAIRPNQLDPAITPLFTTPGHPSYPGAHASLSGSAAEALAYLFPRDTDFFRGRAQEAANSRLWAGIHFRSDNDAGLALARSVSQAIIERVKNDGSQ
jgi:membrane-associated phospholipid phosphatase